MIIRLLFKFKSLSRLKLIIIIFILDKSILLSTFLKNRDKSYIFVIIMFINIHSSFMFTFVEKCKKYIDHRFILRLLDVLSKF